MLSSQLARLIISISAAGKCWALRKSKESSTQASLVERFPHGQRLMTWVFKALWRRHGAGRSAIINLLAVVPGGRGVIKKTAKLCHIFYGISHIIIFESQSSALGVVDGKTLVIAFLCYNNLILRNFSSSCTLHPTKATTLTRHTNFSSRSMFIVAVKVFAVNGNFTKLNLSAKPFSAVYNFSGSHVKLRAEIWC